MNYSKNWSYTWGYENKPGFYKFIAAVRTFTTNIHKLEKYFGDCCYSTNDKLFGGAFFQRYEDPKSSTRSTMTNKRLTGLALMYIHKNIAIEEEEIVTDFANSSDHNLAI